MTTKVTLADLCNSLSHTWPEEFFDYYNLLDQYDQETVYEAHQRLITSIEKGEELAQKLADFMNGEDGAAVEAFIKSLTLKTHRTLQQSVFGLFLRVMQAWAKYYKEGPGWYDLRNEFTVATSEKIVDLLDGQMPPFI
jgi:uncharacterized protein with NAD-binding domain and iron-sulfur cluster